MIDFSKHHALSNDFLILDAVAEPALASRPGLPALARAMCDRRSGAGADGLIVASCPTAAGGADLAMRLYNADGSEAEMSGNGARCIADFASRRGYTSAAHADALRVRTARGVITINLKRDNAGRMTSCTVDMGVPILDAAAIPARPSGRAHTDRVIDAPIEALIPGNGSEPWTRECGLDGRISCVSLGNPHAVLFCAQVDNVPLERIGPHFERHAAFPERINVQFAQVVSPSEAILRTWERGAGVTLACGTGSCAVVVAGVLTRRLSREATVRMRGGNLTVRWDEATDHVFLTGPAVEVYRGHWPEPG